MPIDVSAESEKKGLFELLYGVISKPTETLRYTVEKKPVAQAILLFVAMMWVVAIAGIPSTYYQFRLMPDPTGESAFIARVLIIISIVAAPFLAVLNLTIFSAIYHGVAKLFKGEGTYGSMVSSIGFASFPRLFETPFSLFVLFGGRLGGSGVFFAMLGLYSLVSLAFRIWSIFLKVIAIRESHNISTGKATLSYIIPWAALWLILVVLIFFIIMFAGIVASSAGGGNLG